MHSEYDFLDPAFLKPQVLADGRLRGVAAHDDDARWHRRPRLSRK
ncbi:hypothetical protein [Pigmentiphaga sp.]|nr:hypothetical protein [Pigmentiphaga sp.]